MTHSDLPTVISLRVRGFTAPRRVELRSLLRRGGFIAALCLGCRSEPLRSTPTAPGEPSVTFVPVKRVSWANPLGHEWELVVWGEPTCSARWSDIATGVAMSVAWEQTTPSGGDVNSDGSPDHYLVNQETYAMAIWDGSSLAAYGFNPDVNVTDDRDGDGLPELWIRRGAALATLYSATGKARFDEHP